MSRRCELTGKAVQTGNLVSHSNRKTRTRFLPNLCNVTLMSEALQRPVRLRIAAAALRSVEHRGGLDKFLLASRDSELSLHARRIKRQVEKRVDIETFFAEAPALHPNAALIQGVVCGVRVEEIEDPLMQKIRYLDKLIDELAKGKALEKILRP